MQGKIKKIIFPNKFFFFWQAVRFHPNSCYVATGSTDRTVRLWDVHSGACVRIMTGHKVGVLDRGSQYRFQHRNGSLQMFLCCLIVSTWLKTLLFVHLQIVYLRTEKKIIYITSRINEKLIKQA